MRILLAALAIALTASTLAYAQPRTIEIGGGTAEQNLLVHSWPTVQTPWRQTDDLWEQITTERWTIGVLVDEHGVVTNAVVTDGPDERREDARALALGMRYRPFVEGGEVVRARFNVTVMAAPADYNGPADRSFPQGARAENLRIRLHRGGCYGSCPVYELEITGAGQVHYVGRRHVAQEGEHTWTISPERVAELIEVFRRSDYFALRGYYAVPAFHLAAQVTSIRIGDQEKFVFNYGATAQLNSTILPPDALAQWPWADQLAPAAVIDVENAIDQIAGVGPYVGSGDE